VRHQRMLLHKTANALKRGWLLKLGGKGFIWKRGYFVLLAEPVFELVHFDGFDCSAVQSTLGLRGVLRVERDSEELSASVSKAAQALSRVGGTAHIQISLTCIRFSVPPFFHSRHARKQWYLPREQPFASPLKIAHASLGAVRWQTLTNGSPRSCRWSKWQRARRLRNLPREMTNAKTTMLATIRRPRPVPLPSTTRRQYRPCRRILNMHSMSRSYSRVVVVVTSLSLRQAPLRRPRPRDPPLFSLKVRRRMSVLRDRNYHPSRNHD